MRTKLTRSGVVVATLLLTGCSVGGTLERRVEEELQTRLGPADRYEVEISGLHVGDGEADHVQALGYGVRMRHGPRVDRMRVDLYDVRYDRARKRLQHADSVRASVWVTADDLGTYLESIDGVAEATVRVAPPDSASVRVRPEILGIPVPAGTVAEVSGRMVGRGPYLDFEVSRAEAIGIQASDALMRRISRRINPLVDLSDLPLGLGVSSVTAQGGAVRVDATGDATTLPR